MNISECWGDTAPNGVATLKSFECVFAALLQVAIPLGGIIAFAVFLLGAFNYLTAGGDPKKAQAAQNTITYAALGLILLIAIWFILQFIADFTNVESILDFTIKSN